MKTVFKRLLSATLAMLLLISGLAFSVSAGSTLVWPVPGHKNLSQGWLGEGVHDGIDITDGSVYGADVVAAMSGTVKYKYTCTQNHVGDNCCDGFGTGLIIYGDDGRWYQYAHMLGNSIPSNVYSGAYVTAGTKIGQVGNTGNSTGAHLHFEINLTNGWHGSVDPMLETYTDNTVQISAPTYAVITIDSIEYYFYNYDGSFRCASIDFDFESDYAEETTFILNKYSTSTNSYETYRSYTSPYIDDATVGIYPGLISSIFDTGKYEAYIIARNSQGEVTSNKVYFNIGYYKLYYDANGGIGVPPLETGVTKVSTITPRKDGYVFVGWSTNKNATTAEYGPGDNILLESDTTLYAVWRTYKLEYSNASFETQTGSSSYVIYETYPTKEGYTFLGWATDRSSDTPEFIPGDTINISSDTVLYPVWKRESIINIYYNANGGEGAPATQSGQSSYIISNTIPVREGYTFLCWLDYATENVPKHTNYEHIYCPGDTVSYSNDLILYAVWCKNEDINNYTITFDGNGGSGVPKKLTGSFFYRIPTTVPTREGYIFSCWGNQNYWSSHMESYYPNSFNNYINATQDTTLYAHWREIENVNLYYNANGGSGAPYSQTGEITYTVSSVKPVRKGYVFRGWSIDRDATTAEYQAGDRISLTKNTTLQAVWVPEHECTYSSVITVQPTCTKPGQKKYTCSSCGDYYTEAIPVLAHKIVTDKAVAATCTSTGKTEGKHCSVCGTVTVALTVIPTKAHTPGDWEISVAPTFKAEGVQVKKCTVCKKVLEEGVIPKLDKMPEIEIKRTSTTAINYGDTLVLQLKDSEIPEGYTIAWFVEGVGVSTWVNEDGCECRVTSIANGNPIVFAKLVDENETVVTDADGEEIFDEITIVSKAGFWKKFISFFKNLFGINRVIY